MKRAHGRLPPALRWWSHPNARMRFGGHDVPFEPIERINVGYVDADARLEQMAREATKDTFATLSRDAEDLFDRPVDVITVELRAAAMRIVREREFDLARMRELARRIKLDDAFLERNVWLVWERSHSYFDDCFATCTPIMRIVDRQTRERGTLSGTAVKVGRNLDVVEVARRIRESVRELLVHEIDEQLLVDGERVFDPHTEAGRARTEGKGP